MESPQAPQATTSSAGSPVAWQTLFWTFVPLAVNTMTQPCDRTCGMDSKYRTYIRSSPFICFTEVLSFVIFLLDILIRGPQKSFKDSMRVFLSRRFAESTESDEKAIKYTTVLRWCFFLVGSLGPGIKLMVMTGVPWAKTIGVLFLISYLFGEMAAFFWWRVERSQRIASEQRLYRLADLKRRESRINKWMFYMGCVLHGMFVCCLLANIWPLPPKLTPTLWSASMETLLKVLIRVVVTIMELVTFAAMVLVWYLMYESCTNSNGVGYTVNILLLGVVVGWLGAVYCAIDLHYLAIDFTVVLEFGFYTLILWGLCTGLVENRLNRSLAENLLLVANEAVDGADDGLVAEPENNLNGGSVAASPWKLDMTSFWSLIMLLYTAALCTVWYIFWYDSKGTVNPSWTSVFG